MLLRFSLKKMSPSLLVSVHIISLLLIPLLPAQLLGDDLERESCDRPFHCGDIENISYPFWLSSGSLSCGHPAFALNCTGNVLTMNANNLVYRVNGMDSYRQILNVSRSDQYLFQCMQHSKDTLFDPRQFHYTDSDDYVTLFYGCDPLSSPWMEKITQKISCHGHPDSNVAIVKGEWKNVSSRCQPTISIPILKSSKAITSFSIPSLSNALKEGFEIRWVDENRTRCDECKKSGKGCGYDHSRKEFACLCQDEHDWAPCKKSNHNIRKWIGIGVGAGGGFLVLMSALLFLLYARRRRKYSRASVISRSMFATYSSRIDSEKGSFPFYVPIFDYDELAKATNNFDPAMELGDGGFGTVFKGKLRDGRVVAVKRLYEHNYKRLEQFMNEVDILARVRHPNLISLYGCTSRQSTRLLLVYEYISNGTVADHISGDLAKPGLPPWSTRLNIAIETAIALVYLHASDIIHRDLKTNNILLDDNFTVKVADFGLSRLFPLDVSHISTAPQGTPGYVDPEYHQCYQLTEKSDVYSFGVVLVELISSLPAVDIMRHRHEINLSALAINKIQANALHELVDANLGFQSDENTREMITAVAELAFQCLQPRHEERPSMKEVLETLQRIQKGGHKGEKPEDIVDTSDVAVLLKNNPLTLSPDTVTMKWVSSSTMSTTPNTSS